MKETEYRRQIIHSLKVFGGSDVYPISFPSMFIQGGVSDIIACIRGYFVAIECKHIENVGDGDGNYLKYGFTPLQLDRARKVLSAHGYAFGFINCWNLRKTIIVRLPYDVLTTGFKVNKTTIAKLPTVHYTAPMKAWELGAFIKSV